MRWWRIWKISGISGAVVCGACLARTVQAGSAPEEGQLALEGPAGDSTEVTKYDFGRAHKLPDEDSELLIKSLNLRLKQAQVFFRHGARTPLHVIPKVEEAVYPRDMILREAYHTVFDYRIVLSDGRDISAEPSPLEKRYMKLKLKGGCHAGQLTALGRDQMYQLGRKLRAEYIDKWGLLDPDYLADEVSIRSSNIMRTIESGRCVLAGLYGNEVLKKKGPIDIPVSYRQEEILFPNLMSCPVLKQINSKTTHNFDEIPGIQEDRLLIERVLGVDSSKGEKKLDFIHIRDDLIARQTLGLAFPEKLAPYMDMIDQNATKMIYYAMTGRHEVERPVGTRLAVGRLLDLAVKLMTGQHILSIGANPTDLRSDEEEASSRRIHLYSTHDSTLVALLEALDIFDWKWPPFAADLRLELWESPQGQNFVRVRYLGKDQVVRGCSSVLVTLEEFAANMAPYLIDLPQYKVICHSKIMKQIEKGEAGDEEECQCRCQDTVSDTVFGSTAAEEGEVVEGGDQIAKPALLQGSEDTKEVIGAKEVGGQEGSRPQEVGMSGEDVAVLGDASSAGGGRQAWSGSLFGAIFGHPKLSARPSSQKRQGCECECHQSSWPRLHGLYQAMAAVVGFKLRCPARHREACEEAQARVL